MWTKTKRMLAWILAAAMVLSAPTGTTVFAAEASVEQKAEIGTQEVSIAETENVIISEDTVIADIASDPDYGIAFMSADNSDDENTNDGGVSAEVSEANAAASISSNETTQYYATLAEAITDAADGQTITMLKDEALTAPGVVSEKSVILDLNGKNITRGKGNTIPYLIGVVSGAGLTIQDTSDEKLGTIQSENYTKEDGKTYAGFGVLSNGTLTLNSGAVSGYYGIYGSGDAAKVAVSGGTVNGTNRAIFGDAGAAIEVSGGTASSELYYGIIVSGANTKLTVCGGTVGGGDRAIGVESGAAMEMSAGEVSGGHGIIAISGDVTISDGTITGTSGKGVEADNGKLTMSGGTITGNTVGIFSSLGTISISGGTVSSTGEDGCAIHSVGADITIDENDGKTLLEGANGINLFNSNKNEAEDNKSSTLIINGGEIKATSGFAISGNNLESARTSVTINDGTVTSPITAIYWPMEGTLTVTGGTITGATGIETKMGTILISGGTIQGTGDYMEESPTNGGSIADGSALLVSAQMYGASTTQPQYITSPNLTVNITGGTLSSAKGNAVTIHKAEGSDTQEAEISVSGTDTTLTSGTGVLVKVIAADNQTVSSDGSSIITNAGESTTIKVSFDVAAAVVDTQSTDAGEKTYYVNYYDKSEDVGSVAGIEAQIDNIYYPTVENALAAAKDGDTVTILSGNHNLTLSDVHITLKNSGDGNVTVNDIALASGKSIGIHSDAVKVPAKAATYSADGNIEYWYCDGCGRYFADEALTKEITQAQTVIPKKIWVSADYTAVDAAIKKAEALNKDHYTDFSAVDAAINAVIRGKSSSSQAAVDAMAKAIEDAIGKLVYKSADYSVVDAAIEKASALNPTDYKDFSAVEEAIGAVIRDKNITQQAEVDAMAEAIEKAMTALVKRSSNADLIELTLDKGVLSPVFDTSVTSYTAVVPNSVKSITLTPTASDTGAVITVNGKEVASANVSGAISLKEGVNTITVKVTAEDGTSVKTYTVKVTRAAAKGKTYTVSGLRYQVTKDSVTSGTVTFTGYAGNKLTKLRIPKTIKIYGITYRVTAVGDKACKGKTKLQKITVGSNVTKIGMGAFYKCTNLKSITIGANVASIGGHAFCHDTKLRTMTFNGTKLAKVGNHCLYKLQNLTIKAPASKVTKYKKLFKGKAARSYRVVKK